MSEAWNDVCPAGELAGMKFFLIDRTHPKVFDLQYTALRDAATGFSCVYGPQRPSWVNIVSHPDAKQMEAVYQQTSGGSPSPVK